MRAHTRPRSPFVPHFGLPGEARSHEDAARTGPGVTVVPFGYRDVHAESEDRTGEHDQVTGLLRAIDRVGQLVLLSVDLEEDTEVRTESHVEKLGDHGPAPAAKLRLSWRPDRTTVVAGYSS